MVINFTLFYRNAALKILSNSFCINFQTDIMMWYNNMHYNIMNNFYSHIFFFFLSFETASKTSFLFLSVFCLWKYEGSNGIIVVLQRCLFIYYVFSAFPETTFRQWRCDPIVTQHTHIHFSINTYEEKLPTNYRENW